MSLETILDSPDWTPELFNREIGREEFAKLARASGGKLLDIKHRYAQLFYKLDKKPVREYLAQQGITDLRQVTGRVDGQYSAFRNLSYGFGSVTGLWTGKKVSQDVRAALVQHGIIEGRLVEYGADVQQAIMRDSFNHKYVAADYFNKEVVGDDVAEENLQVLFDSRIPRDYLAQQGITDLRHVTENIDGEPSAFHNLSWGFGSVTGLWKGTKTSREVRAALVSHGILPGKLAKYGKEVQQEIMRDAFNHNSLATDYFNRYVVGPEIAEDNLHLLEQYKQKMIDG